MYGVGVCDVDMGDCGVDSSRINRSAVTADGECGGDVGISDFVVVSGYIDCTTCGRHSSDFNESHIED